MPFRKEEQYNWTNNYNTKHLCEKLIIHVFIGNIFFLLQDTIIIIINWLNLNIEWYSTKHLLALSVVNCIWCENIQVENLLQVHLKFASKCIHSRFFLYKLSCHMYMYIYIWLLHIYIYFFQCPTVYCISISLRFVSGFNIFFFIL